MSSNICGATTTSGTPCKRLSVVGGKRCHLHGGYSTGPRTFMGKLRCGNGFRNYKGRRGGPGPRTDKTAKRRAANIERMARWLEHRIKREATLRARERRRRVALGLPLYDEPDAS